MNNHVMIDLETLGKRPSSVFLSVAACQFDIETGELGKKFRMNVSLKSALKAGRKVDADTIKWWMEQRGDIRGKMFENGEELIYVLEEFQDWILDVGLLSTDGNVFVWSNSASFDIGMLNHAYCSQDLLSPWNFRNERCYRTAVAHMKDTLGIYTPILPQKPDNAHDPAVDAEHQVEVLFRLHSVTKTLIFTTETGY
jgi:hypothetical protein